MTSSRDSDKAADSGEDISDTLGSSDDDLDLFVEEPEKVKREEFPTDTKNENRLLLFQKGIIVPWLDGEEVVLMAI